MEGQTDAFHVRYLSEWTPDRLYRVYPARGVLYFIRIGGQGGLEMMHLGFGLLGALFEGYMKRKGESRAAEIPHTAEVDPETLVDDHKHNRKISAADVLESTITPSPRMAGHGSCFGRWTLALAGGERWKLQFEELEHMHTAVRVLPPLLGGTLLMRAAWDEALGKYMEAADDGWGT